MDTDDKRPPPVVKFIEFLEIPKTAHDPADPVQGEVPLVVGPRVALERNGGIECIYLPVLQIPEKVIIGDLLPRTPDEFLCEPSMDRLCMGQAAEFNISDRRESRSVACSDHTPQKQHMPPRMSEAKIRRVCQANGVKKRSKTISSSKIKIRSAPSASPFPMQVMWDS